MNLSASVVISRKPFHNAKWYELTFDLHEFEYWSASLRWRLGGATDSPRKSDIKLSLVEEKGKILYATRQRFRTMCFLFQFWQVIGCSSTEIRSPITFLPVHGWLVKLCNQRRKHCTVSSWSWLSIYFHTIDMSLRRCQSHFSFIRFWMWLIMCIHDMIWAVLSFSD